MDREAAVALRQIQRATARMLDRIAGLTDAQAREASPLPGWTRGHVLAHLARNADAVGNLLRSARSGERIPMYASREARDAAIEAGAGRPAAELVADVRASAGALEEEAAGLPDDAWHALVSSARGEIPARVGLLMRLSEVEVHHVDLGLGYRPSDWPEEFAAPQLARVAAAWSAREDVPPCLLRPDGAGPVRISPASAPGAAGPVTVSGPGWALLAWALGREEGGANLRVDPPGPLPAMPAW